MLRSQVPVTLKVHRADQKTWVSRSLMRYPSGLHPETKARFQQIEERARRTEAVGALPLWQGYSALTGYPTDVSGTAKRSSNDVRTARRTGEFYTWLVQSRKPGQIVEIGSAFGVSGMYWCAGLALNGSGEFTGFEPNGEWAPLAEANVKSILDRAKIVVGPFEENMESAPAGVDLAFIDAIHTPEFVQAQLDLILTRAQPGALIMLDDIRFSPEMTAYWLQIREDERFAAAFEVTERVGGLEVRR